MHRVTCCALAVLILAASDGHAQRPPGADSMTAAAAAESLAVIRRIDTLLKASPRDPQLWLRRGLAAWSLAERDRYGDSTIKGVDWTLLRRMADTSLRIAVQLAPDDPSIMMALGQLHISSGLITTRIQAYGLFEDALVAARTAGDPQLLSEAAIEAGRTHWRRYELHAHPHYEGTFGMEAQALAENLMKDYERGQTRAWDPDSGARRVQYTRQSVRWARDSIRRGAAETMGQGFGGEADYIRAENHFREAYHANPSSVRAYRHLAMLYAERERWSELRTLARDRLREEPLHTWAWLSLGLSSHRLGDDRIATAAFDSATLFMSPGERRRLDRFERVLRPVDAARVVQLSDSLRAVMGNTYWRAVDQLWSRPEEKPRTEFLARVAYADLRWTVDEMLARGADTDRGDIHIRYGPPDLQVTAKRPGTEGSDQITMWAYDYARLTFAFVGMPSFSTSFYASPWSVAEVVDSMPARWDNITSVRIDSMPIGITRFRGGGDTAEVVLTARPDVERIGMVADLRTTVRSDAWLLHADLEPVWHDSVLAARTGNRSWRQRMGVGDYFFRTEATAETSRLAARAFVPLRIRAERNGFAFRGFGMSDLLFAEAPSAVTDAARWDALGVTAITPRAAGGRFALVWESYELGERDGSAVYDVLISIRPVEARLSRIIANTFGAIGARVGVERGPGRVDVRYSRRVAHRPTLVEQIGLNLTGTPPGTYELTLEIRDQVTQQRTSRRVHFAIVEEARR